ncbi:MAG TPA: hypothetical protein DDW23_04380 [Planctomycetes bacterium]|jgi:hypothetical protein|nr:hypothetical protein [Planctomycetota bacterium]
MQLRPCSLGFALGVLAGVGVLVVGLLAQYFEGYGAPFLVLLASGYPGFEASGGLGDLLVGTFYALLDGFVGGAALAWLYNFCSVRCATE